MRVLVTGASGFLGYHLCQFLHEGGAEVIGTWRSRELEVSSFLVHHVDLADKEAVRELLTSSSPTHIVHSAALTSTSVCEAQPELAYRENFTATEVLVRVASEILRPPPFLLYVSTDLVFDGTRGNYKEEEAPNPIMVYGRTKRAAEEAVELTYAGPWAIVRSALIYGLPTPTGRGSFLAWLLDDLARGECRLFVDEYRCPIFVKELCWLITTILQGTHEGLWHAAGPDRLSRFEIGRIVAEAFNLPLSNLHAASLKETVVPAPRPADVSLNIAKARRELGFAPKSFKENVAMLARIYPAAPKSHKGA